MSQVAGNSIPFRLKNGNMLLLSYVSLGEWQTLKEILDQTVERDSFVVHYLIGCSVRRGGSSLNARKTRHLMRKNKSRLPAMINVICKLSLPSISTPSNAKSKQDTAKNEKIVYRVLSRIHGWTPQEISVMSPAQVHIYLMGGSTGTGTEQMTSSQYQQFMSERGLSR